MLNSNLPTLVLGSSSPRRKDLLSNLGFDYVVVKPDVEEKQNPGEMPRDYVYRNATMKADWVKGHLPAAFKGKPVLIVCADTIVVLGDEVLEKPKDFADAYRMMNLISGKTHQVLTAFALVDTAKSNRVTEVVTTDVTIKSLKKKEIESYLATGEPFDKAGSYAIQGRGGFMVEKISGSYSNVVGLPLAELMAAIEEKLGYDLWA